MSETLCHAVEEQLERVHAASTSRSLRFNVASIVFLDIMSSVAYSVVSRTRVTVKDNSERIHIYHI